jgi:Family of unknown function (DUF6364)
MNLSHTILCYTDPVQKNLTLTIDEELLRSARKAALDRNTSVNQLVREYLESLTRQEERQEKALAEMREMFRTSEFKSHPVKWKREDLYEPRRKLRRSSKLR